MFLVILLNFFCFSEIDNSKVYTELCVLHIHIPLKVVKKTEF
jgi:hypothetical protein